MEFIEIYHDDPVETYEPGAGQSMTIHASSLEGTSGSVLHLLFLHFLVQPFDQCSTRRCPIVRTQIVTLS